MMELSHLVVGPNHPSLLATILQDWFEKNICVDTIVYVRQNLKIFTIEAHSAVLAAASKIFSDVLKTAPVTDEPYQIYIEGYRVEAVYELLHFFYYGYTSPRAVIDEVREIFHDFRVHHYSIEKSDIIPLPGISDSTHQRPNFREQGKDDYRAGASWSMQKGSYFDDMDDFDSSSENDYDDEMSDADDQDEFGLYAGTSRNGRKKSGKSRVMERRKAARHEDGVVMPLSVEIEEGAEYYSDADGDDGNDAGGNESNSGDKKRSRRRRKVEKAKKERCYDCTFCGKKFFHKGHMERHMRKHTTNQQAPEGHFQCTLCEKEFSKKGYLQKHMMIHTGEQRYRFQCPLCEKKFAFKSHLKEHSRTHTKERPFQCELCGKTFSSNCALARHKFTHATKEQYRFECEFCNAKFYRKDKLVKHQRIHTANTMNVDPTPHPLAHPHVHPNPVAYFNPQLQLQ